MWWKEYSVVPNNSKPIHDRYPHETNHSHMPSSKLLRRSINNKSQQQTITQHPATTNPTTIPRRNEADPDHGSHHLGSSGSFPGNKN